MILILAYDGCAWQILWSCLNSVMICVLRTTIETNNILVINCHQFCGKQFLVAFFLLLFFVVVVAVVCFSSVVHGETLCQSNVIIEWMVKFTKLFLWRLEKRRQQQRQKIVEKLSILSVLLLPFETVYSVACTG